MSLPTPKDIKRNLRSQIRSLKSRGLSYDEIGQRVLKDGRPIGRTTAANMAKRQDGECWGCLRKYVK